MTTVLAVIAAWIDTIYTPLGIACLALIFGAPVAWLIYGALTGPRPSAAEVARAERMAATPAHPAGKAIREPEDSDLAEWERRYAASQTADRRRKW